MISHKKAVELAKAFSVLSHYPEIPEALEATAELVGELCANDEQADWLRHEICLSGRYTRWGGPGWLHDIWAGQFNRMPVYLAPGVLPESEALCGRCQSLGQYFNRPNGKYERCPLCAYGVLVEDKLLDLLNGKKLPPFQGKSRFPDVKFTPITAQDLEVARRQVEENFEKVRQQRLREPPSGDSKVQ